MTNHSKDVQDAINERKLTKIIPNTKTAEGWNEGEGPIFETTNTKFSYPNPDITSEMVQDNLQNINLLKRQIRVLWPEFSWQTIPGVEQSRAFEMFAPDISRLGYDNKGRVYSVICPQQGTYTKEFGAFNVEVTVTGNRGWINEDNKEEHRLCGQVGVVGQIWFSETAHELPLVKGLMRYFNRKFKDSGYGFPFCKKNAIKVTTHAVGKPGNPYFYFKTGVSKLFVPPSWTTHHDESYQNANLSVQIGPIKKTESDGINYFNQMILNVFNAASGNMLKDGNVLTWNMWFDWPSKVDVNEWKNHAKKWRISIDTDHGSPSGDASKVRFRDARVFTAAEHFKEELIHAILGLRHIAEHKDAQE